MSLTSEMEHLAQGLEDFRERHAEDCRRLQAERKEFVVGITANEKEQVIVRQEFVADIREKVADLRKENQADIAGMHEAWSTHVTGVRPVARPVARAIVAHKGKKRKG